MLHAGAFCFCPQLGRFAFSENHVYLWMGNKRRGKHNRKKTNRLKASLKAKNRKRINRMQGKRAGKKLGRSGVSR